MIPNPHYSPDLGVRGFILTDALTILIHLPILHWKSMVVYITLRSELMRGSVIYRAEASSEHWMKVL